MDFTELVQEVTKQTAITTAKPGEKKDSGFQSQHTVLFKVSDSNRKKYKTCKNVGKYGPDKGENLIYSNCPWERPGIGLIRRKDPI